jgi:hypothetical protein
MQRFRAGVASIHYTEYRVGLSSVEPFLNQPELPLMISRMSWPELRLSIAIEALRGKQAQEQGRVYTLHRVSSGTRLG